MTLFGSAPIPRSGAAKRVEREREKVPTNGSSDFARTWGRLSSARAGGGHACRRERERHRPESGDRIPQKNRPGRASARSPAPCPKEKKEKRESRSTSGSRTLTDVRSRTPLLPSGRTGTPILSAISLNELNTGTKTAKPLGHRGRSLSAGRVPEACSRRRRRRRERRCDSRVEGEDWEDSNHRSEHL